MKRVCLTIVCIFSVAAVASASTVYLSMDNLAANGWKTTATNVWGGSPNASVTETSDHGTGNFRFYTGLMPISWQFQWAGLSTDAFAGKSLASITSLKISEMAASGDGINWQPPTFSFVVNKGDGNQRCISWDPWPTGSRGTVLNWYEYDATTTGQWIVEETQTRYNSFAALKAALPNATFEPTSALPLDWGYASQHAFNVGFCPLYDEDRTRFNGDAGYVDWFEVGVNGEITRYDLPEPASLALLAAGLGVLGLRRRS